MAPPRELTCHVTRSLRERPWAASWCGRNEGIILRTYNTLIRDAPKTHSTNGQRTEGDPETLTTQVKAKGLYFQPLISVPLSCSPRRWPHPQCGLARPFPTPPQDSASGTQPHMAPAGSHVIPRASTWEPPLRGDQERHYTDHSGQDCAAGSVSGPGAVSP